MKVKQTHEMPRWIYLLIASGAFWASGVYTGKGLAQGGICLYILQVIGFTLLGLVMAWGAK